MKHFSYPIADILTKGLAPTFSKRNQPYLVQSIGAIPYENTLQALETFETVDVSILGPLSFPYPQLFVFSDCIVVCTETVIFELAGSLVPTPLSTGNLLQENGSRILQENGSGILRDALLTNMIQGLPAGEVWVALDFKTYLYFTNGVVAVTKDPTTGLYAIDTSVPYAQAACDFNGQVLLGAPNLT